MCNPISQIDLPLCWCVLVKMVRVDGISRTFHHCSGKFFSYRGTGKKLSAAVKTSGCDSRNLIHLLEPDAEGDTVKVFELPGQVGHLLEVQFAGDQFCRQPFFGERLRLELPEDIELVPQGASKLLTNEPPQLSRLHVKQVGHFARLILRMLGSLRPVFDLCQFVCHSSWSHGRNLFGVHSLEGRAGRTFRILRCD